MSLNNKNNNKNTQQRNKDLNNGNQVTEIAQILILRTPSRQLLAITV